MAQPLINLAQRATPLDIAAKLPAGRPPLVAIVGDAASETAINEYARQLAVSHHQVIRGGVAKAIQYLEAERSPSILVVDIDDVDLPVSKINDLAEVCEPSVTVIAIGQSNDVGLYRDLIAAGITDYIVKPVTPQLLAKALTHKSDRGVAAPISQKLGKLVACIGARGGVGTTTVAVGLAWHLANRQNRRVALLDLDLQHGHCALALNVRPTPGWREALTNPGRVDPVFLERAMGHHGDRLGVLSSEESLRDNLHVTVEAVETAVSLLRAEVHYVVVDVPRVPADPYRWVLNQADFRVIVADQTLHSARDAARLRAMLDQDGARHRDLLVVNRGGEAGRHAISVSEMQKVLEARPSVVIPYDAARFTKAINAGKLPGSTRGKVADALAALATEMAGYPAKRRGWWRRGR